MVFYGTNIPNAGKGVRALFNRLRNWITGTTAATAVPAPRHPSEIAPRIVNPAEIFDWPDPIG